LLDARNAIHAAKAMPNNRATAPRSRKRCRQHHRPTLLRPDLTNGA
jgi:hypothetical protein